MSPSERLEAVRRELKSSFVERDVVVDGALIAVLAGQHVLLLGPPGTAKSMLAKALCHRLDGKRYFEWLLTKFTTPEEVFGPVSLAALEGGRYERVTEGKLPTAEVAFLDEVFKASSAILNAMLTLLNERRFYQGSTSTEVPLEILIGASNELPEEDDLAALYDRFLLRFTVDYVADDERFFVLLGLDARTPAEAARLSAAELVELKRAVAQADVPSSILRDMVELRHRLQGDGVVASDRRWRQSILVLKAAAVLEGRARVQLGDLRWLEHVLFSDPEDRPKVLKAIQALATGLEEESRKLVNQAQEIEAYARREWPDRLSASRAVLEAHTKLEDIKRRLRALLETGRERGREIVWLEEASARVEQMQSKLLGAKN